MGADTQALLITYDQLREYDDRTEEIEKLKAMAGSGRPNVKRRRK